jgi:hypothetical protein
MQATFLSEPDSEQLAQRSHIADLKWEGSDVVEITGTVADIYKALPVFGRYPYRSGGEDNRYKDEIRREPQRIDEDQLPIGTVGKTYALIQHRDVLASVYRALKLLGVDCADLESELLMSEYGERIQWCCTRPKFSFDPGDGEPLIVRVNCLNSVDMTTVLEVSLAWFRLVCSNGMMFGLGDSRLRGTKRAVSKKYAALMVARK